MSKTTERELDRALVEYTKRFGWWWVIKLEYVGIDQKKHDVAGFIDWWGIDSNFRNIYIQSTSGGGSKGNSNANRRLKQIKTEYRRDARAILKGRENQIQVWNWKRNEYGDWYPVITSVTDADLEGE